MENNLLYLMHCIPVENRTIAASLFQPNMRKRAEKGEHRGTGKREEERRGEESQRGEKRREEKGGGSDGRTREPVTTIPEYNKSQNNPYLSAPPLSACRTPPTRTTEGGR